MNQPLAIVGASTRAAAASAKRAGFLPLAADLFADADLRAIATTTRISPYPDGFLDWLRTIEPPAWMYTGALENHPELVDQMAWVAPLWGNPGDVLARVRSPWELGASLRTAGLLFPETHASADGLPNDGTWLSKTYHGASGSGVRVWGQSGRVGDGETGRLCFQQKLAGIPAAAVFVGAEGGAMLLGVTRQLIGELWVNGHGFQYCGSIGPLSLDDAAMNTIAEIGNVLAAEFELVGLFGVDFIANDEGVWTLEVNPRFTASVEIVERVTGVSAIGLHARACGGEANGSWRAGASSPPSGALNHGGGDAPARCHGKAILFAKRDVALTDRFVEEAMREAAAVPWPTLGDVSPAGLVIEAGRPILTVFTEGESTNDVERRLRHRTGEIEQRVFAN